MFYCNKCADKKNWPRTMAKSLGNCEACGKPAVFNNNDGKPS